MSHLVCTKESAVRLTDVGPGNKRSRRRILYSFSENVIPGVATVEVRSTGAAITGLKVTPLPLTGEASKHPPAADVMQVSTADPSFYTGAV